MKFLVTATRIINNSLVRFCAASVGFRTVRVLQGIVQTCGFVCTLSKLQKYRIQSCMTCTSVRVFRNLAPKEGWVFFS